MKKTFVTGLFGLVPILATIFFMVFVVNQFDALLIPQFVEKLIGFRIPGLGIIVMVVLTFIVGAVARNIFGNKLLEWSDGILSRLPLAGAIYQGTKQLMKSVFMKDARAFREVVLVEFPRAGLYTIGFVTGDPPAALQGSVAPNSVSIFVPTAPNPTSGFFMIATADQVRPLKITVAEAFKLIVSAGIVSSEKSLLV